MQICITIIALKNETFFPKLPSLQEKENLLAILNNKMITNQKS